MSDTALSAESHPGAAIGTGGDAGTLRVFKWLRRGRMETVPHNRHAFVSVDVYELPFFEAVTSADEVSSASRVQFYVYHESDATARGADGRQVSVETRDDRWHIPFEDALRMVGVKCDDDQHLGDVVVDFWNALFAPPSDSFDETSYGVSPWLERNVGDRRTVGSLRVGQGGEWNNIKFRFRPTKTLNWPASSGSRLPEEPGLMMLLEAMVTYRKGNQDGAWDQALAIHDRLAQMRRDWESGGAGRPAPYGAPPGVEVVQLDLNTVGLRLLDGGPEQVAVMALLRA